jgi:hypothetical protein
LWATAAAATAAAAALAVASGRKCAAAAVGHSLFRKKATLAVKLQEEE